VVYIAGRCGILAPVGVFNVYRSGHRPSFFENCVGNIGIIHLIPFEVNKFVVNQLPFVGYDCCFGIVMK